MEWLLRVEQPEGSELPGEALLASLLHGHVSRVLVPLLIASGCGVRLETPNERTVVVYVQAPVGALSRPTEYDNGAYYSQSPLHRESSTEVRGTCSALPGSDRAR